MLKRKSLVIGMAALLATAATIQPVMAQYGDPYQQRDSQYNQYNDNQYDQYNDNQYDQYDDYGRTQQDYYRQLDQYERDRQYYEQQRAGQYYNPPPPRATYSQYDDPYYRDCRQQRQGNTVAGLIIGGALGAALGSTVARGPARGGGTALGAILGGALGAGIGNNSLNCDDRNYVYTMSYDAFNRGIPRRTYEWRNPRTGNYGRVYVGDYYRGDFGYRCANYTQTIWVRGRPVPASGHACRQPDGNWVIVD